MMERLGRSAQVDSGVPALGSGVRGAGWYCWVQRTQGGVGSIGARCQRPLFLHPRVAVLSCLPPSPDGWSHDPPLYQAASPVDMPWNGQEMQALMCAFWRRGKDVCPVTLCPSPLAWTMLCFTPAPPHTAVSVLWRPLGGRRQTTPLLHHWARLLRCTLLRASGPIAARRRRVGQTSSRPAHRRGGRHLGLPNATGSCNIAT